MLHMRVCLLESHRLWYADADSPALWEPTRRQLKMPVSAVKLGSLMLSSFDSRRPRLWGLRLEPSDSASCLTALTLASATATTIGSTCVRSCQIEGHQHEVQHPASSSSPLC